MKNDNNYTSLYRTMLELADDYAKSNTGCLKVDVGCIIVDDEGRIISTGANISLPNCKKTGICNRVKLYGNASKEHRLPSDCNAIHSEVNAIINAGCDLHGCTAIVTRYPCEACARALVNAGIKKVVWGRRQDISEATKEIFKEGNVTSIWFKDWISNDVEY